MLEYKIDERYVKSGSDFVHSFLGNRACLEYFLNNLFNFRYFPWKF